MSETTVVLDPTEARRPRGLAIAALCRITEKNGFWHVPSQTGNGSYRVTLDPAPFVPQCTCKDYEKTGKPCKHVFAVEYVIEREKHPDGSETTTETVTVTQTTAKTIAPKKTYKQVWPAYNAAQTNEKHKFQVLLHDLCKGVQEPQRKAPEKGGRPRLSLADMVFAATFKIFSTISARRFSCDLKDAHERGYLDRLPHFNSVLNYLENPVLTPVLKALIAQSSLPLKAVDVDFAVDSSGFATSRFVRWFDHKYGIVKKEYDWINVSLMCGVKTNVVTAVVVDEKKGGDCPQFVPLVKATAENFTIRDVSSDKAYLSYENADLVAVVGGTPFILPKSNTTGGDGGMLAKMFHYYSFHRDDFLNRYHKRSNIESTFSMIKAKFGDSLRSKTDTAMVNEALCKVLCHNLCCLIQSHYELGIKATFWGDVNEKPTDVLTTSDSVNTIDAWAWV